MELKIINQIPVFPDISPFCHIIMSYYIMECYGIYYMYAYNYIIIFAYSHRWLTNSNNIWISIEVTLCNSIHTFTH